GVLAFVDYRRAAEREGYPPDDVVALELQLRFEKDRNRDLAIHRDELAAERAAEKAARDQAAAAKRAAADAVLAQRKRGTFGELGRAAVRGLIPFDRLEETLTGELDADTIAILMADVQADRAAYVAAQAAADQARIRASHRDLSIGELESAVLAGVL